VVVVVTMVVVVRDTVVTLFPLASKDRSRLVLPGAGVGGEGGGEE